MIGKKFDVKKLQKLNNPDRLKDIPVELIFDKLQLEKAETFIEIGAGTAFFSIAFSRHAHPATLYACDISAAMIAWMEENVVTQHPEIIPVRTKENVVPLEDKCADLLFMINLHHELDEPELLLQESLRLLKDGGTILIIDWKKLEMAEGPPLHIRCSQQEVVSELAAAGFSSIECFDNLTKHFVIIGKK